MATWRMEEPSSDIFSSLLMSRLLLQVVRVMSTVVSGSYSPVTFPVFNLSNVDSNDPYSNFAWAAMEFVIISLTLSMLRPCLETQLSSAMMVMRTSVLLGRLDLAPARERPTMDLIWSCSHIRWRLAGSPM